MVTSTRWTQLDIKDFPSVSIHMSDTSLRLHDMSVFNTSSGVTHCAILVTQRITTLRTWRYI